MSPTIQVVTLTVDDYKRHLAEAAELGATLALRTAQSIGTHESWDIPRCMAELGIKETKLRALVAADNIPYFKIGNRIRFRPADIRDWQGTDGQKSAGEKRMEAELAERRKKAKR